LDTVVVYAKAVSGNKLVLEATARQFALTLSRIYIATLVIEHAVWAIANPNVNTVDPVTDIATVKYWCSRNPLVVLETTEPKNIDLRAIEALAMDKGASIEFGFLFHVETHTASFQIPRQASTVALARRALTESFVHVIKLRMNTRQCM
jgi:hypothetical protein